MDVPNTNDGRRLEALMGRLGRLTRSHPGKIAVAFILLTAAMVVPLTGMDSSTSMEDFTPDSEFLEGAKVLRNEFDPESPKMLVVEAVDGSMTDREGLEVLRSIEGTVVSSETLAPRLTANGTPVVSLAGPVEAYLSAVSNGSLDIGSAPDEVLEGAVAAVMADPSASLLVSQVHTGRYALVIVNLVPPSPDEDEEVVEAELEDVVGGAVPDGYRLHSFLVFNEKMRQDTVEGLSILMPLALLMVVAVLWFALRSVVDVLISVAGVVVILLVTFGLYSMTGLGFSQLLFFGPILILVLSIDFAIHVLHRFNEDRRSGLGQGDAMERSIRLVGVAVLVSTLTTAVAFASNGLSSIPAVAGFGVFLGLGISVSFVVMVLFVPSVKLLLAGRGAPVRGSTSKAKWGVLVRLVRVANTYPLSVVAVAAALFCGSMMVAGSIPNDMSAKDALSADSDVVQAIDLLNTEFPVTGSAGVHVILMGDVTDPVVLEAVERFVEDAGSDAHVASIDGEPAIVSVVPLVRLATTSSDGGTGVLDADGNGIPDTRAGVVLVLRGLWSDGLPGIATPEQVGRMLSPDASGGSFDGMTVAIETTTEDSHDVGLLLEDLERDLEPLRDLQGVKVYLAGGELEGYQMSTGMTRGMLRSTLVTIVVCTLIVILLMRSVRLGLVTAVPIVLISGWILGLMYVMGYSLNMVTASITAMTVGVGMDFSIHLMQRYREERANGHVAEAAMERTVSTTGVSLLAAAGTTLIGFVVIATSDIAMFRTFGILSTAMIVLSLASSLLVLPALISIDERGWFHAPASWRARSRVASGGPEPGSAAVDGSLQAPERTSV